MNAAHVDAREVIVTDSQFQKAIPQDDIIDKRAPEKLLPLVREGKVPVMGGFIASNEAGITGPRWDAADQIFYRGAGGAAR